MKKIKILSSLVLLALVVPALSLARAEDSVATGTKKGPLVRMENKEVRMENRLAQASSTENRLENRENNIERIRARIASTTASTSEKRVDRLNDRLSKQVEQMEKVRDRLLNKETKVIAVLGKIADKIAERITILEGKSLNMTAAKAKLAEARTKITEMTTTADTLADLLETEITEANKTQLFAEVKTAEETIRTLARTTHSLLVDTIKEITKVLPAKTATTTATTTN